MRRLTSHSSREEGFTLIELLIVIVIIGVLTAVAMPIYLQYQRDTQKTALRMDVKSTAVNVERYISLRPAASSTELNDPANVRKTISLKNNIETITINGDWSNYTVVGQATQVFGSDSAYTYDSTTGKMTGTGKFVN